MLYEAGAVISVNSFLHLHQYFYTEKDITGVTSVVCDRRSSSTGYRVVLHLFKYSYRDSISEQANYGSLAKAMERVLNCCNCECIADSDLDKQKPVDRCTGKIPRSK